MHPAARDLFAWHLTEELEHRTVAFDVYEHVCGGYSYRLAVGLFAQWHLNRFVLRVAGVLRNTDREAFRKNTAAERRPGRACARCTDNKSPGSSQGPGHVSALYTPHANEMPAVAKALSDHYAALSTGAAQGPA